MKKLFIIVLLFLVNISFSQNTIKVRKDSVKYEAIWVTENVPTFIDGQSAIYKIIKDSLVYPKEAIKANIQGRVWVQFVVEIDSTISNIKVLRGIGYGCDKEAIRVTKLLNKWIPASDFGNPKKLKRKRMNLPINFKLS